MSGERHEDKDGEGRQVPPHRSGGGGMPPRQPSEQQVLRDLFERECQDGDKLAEALGVPRTEGGSLNVPRMLARIAELRGVTSATDTCNKCGGLGYIQMTDGLGNDSMLSCECTPRSHVVPLKAQEPDADVRKAAAEAFNREYPSSTRTIHCDLCHKPKSEQPCGATHCPGVRMTRDEVIETARELFGFYGWSNERDLQFRKRIEIMRNMALALLDAQSATKPRRYTPEELLEVAVNTLIPEDMHKRSALLTLIAVLGDPDKIFAAGGEGKNATPDGAQRHTGYEPDCADCPVPAECKAANRCTAMEKVRPTDGGGQHG